MRTIAFVAGLVIAGSAHALPCKWDAANPSEVICVADDGVTFQLAGETTYQSLPGDAAGQSLTAMMHDGRMLMLMPSDTELRHIDTSEGYLRLYRGSCVAAPPAKCQMPNLPTMEIR